MKYVYGILAATLCWLPFAAAQHAPDIGYMFPPGTQAGRTVEVVLGGYDWTPDMQVFVHDPRITLEILAPPGPIIVPEPPYWIGKKSRRAPFPLPRETRARLTVPADVSPGTVEWQAANANGATTVGLFAIAALPTIVERPLPPPIADSVTQPPPQVLPMLPVCVSGQIKHIGEVDRYHFTADHTGPVTCSLLARRINSLLNAVLEIQNGSGQRIADAADTAGNDCSLTFTATAGETYTVSVYDLDFRGNRSFVYQLELAARPHVVAAIPSVGQRGTTVPVEFVGYGIVTGRNHLESTVRNVTFPMHADNAHVAGPKSGVPPGPTGIPEVTAFSHELTTEHGISAPFDLFVSDDAQLPPADSRGDAAARLTVPCGVTGILEHRFQEDRYIVSGKQGDQWMIFADGEGIGSQVDPGLVVLDAAENELARNDDQPGSTRARIDFTVPKDGNYFVAVFDVASASGSRSATYYLSLRSAKPDFSLSIPPVLSVLIAGKSSLAVGVVRQAGFTDAIDVRVSGLPDGVTVADSLQIPAGQNTLNIELSVAETAAATASVVEVTGAAKVGERTVERSAGRVLLATTIKPPFEIDAEGLDDVAKWPRGTTFPAPVLISRDAGFDQTIVLEMTSRQGRHRQGITGPELVVQPGVNRILYPVFLPEWLETTRTSRMVLNGVAQVKDPRGNVRYSVSRQKTRMGFLPTGALLKISARITEFHVTPGQTFVVPISIDRSPRLSEPLHLELRQPDDSGSNFSADRLEVAGEASQAELSITAAADASGTAEHRLTIRATALKDGKLPVVSEAAILIQRQPPATTN